eukprot:6483754-Amphidinium_carterae.1
MHRWQQRLRHVPAEEVVTGICQHCTLVKPETEQHILWECPAWQRCRRFQGAPAGAPQCFLTLGIPVDHQRWARVLRQYHSVMVDIIITRAAAREDLDARPAQASTMGQWKPQYRITNKRTREDIVARPPCRDARGRLSRRLANMDAFQNERDRLLQRLRDIPEPELARVQWPMPVAGKRRKYTLFNAAFER